MNRKRKAAVADSILCYSAHTGLLCVDDTNSINMLESISAFKNHADHPQSHQKNRIQNLLLLQSKEVDARCAEVNPEGKDTAVHPNQLSRSTSFIAESHIHPEIFRVYYKIYIDREANLFTCPAFMIKLKLNDFNREWLRLRAFLGGQTVFNITRELLVWKDALNYSIPNFQSWSQFLQETPEQYHYLVGNFLSGDLVLFMPGVIHHVIKATDSNTLRVKISSELSESIHSESNGMSSGNYKKDARQFEENRKDLIAENQRIESKEIEVQTLSEDALTDASYQLKKYGVVVLRKALGEIYSERLFQKSVRYLHQICDLPTSFDLTNPTQASYLHNKEKRLESGISDRMIRRQAANSRSTIVAKDHGITGIGWNCAALRQAYQESLKSLFQGIYKHMFDANTHVVTDIGIHFQPPVLP